MASFAPPHKRRKTHSATPFAGSAQEHIHISDLGRLLIPPQSEQLFASSRGGANGAPNGPSEGDVNFVSLETAYGTLDEKHKRHIILAAAMAVPALAAFLRIEHDRTRKSITDFDNRVREFDWYVSPESLSDDWMGEEERKTAGYIRASFHAISSRVKKDSHFETKAHGLKALAELANLLNSRMENEAFQGFMERNLYQGVFMDAIRSVIGCMTATEKVRLRNFSSEEVWNELVRLNSRPLFFDEFPETFRVLDEESSRPVPESSENDDSDEDNEDDDDDDDDDDDAHMGDGDDDEEEEDDEQDEEQSW